MPQLTAGKLYFLESKYTSSIRSTAYDVGAEIQKLSAVDHRKHGECLSRNQATQQILSLLEIF